MNLIKLILPFMILTSYSAYASELSGTISVTGKAPKGTLYIFARKFGSQMPMPLAVQRVENPVFPVKFKLDESMKMVEGMPFKGPFVIVARISPSGGAMDKSGIEVKTSKPIKLGNKNIKLNLTGTK